MPVMNVKVLPSAGSMVDIHERKLGVPAIRDGDGESISDQSASRHFCQRFTDFCGETSVGGLKYVTDRSGGWFRRILWLLLVLFGMGFMGYQIATRVLFYYTWPTIVDVKVNFNDSLLFPIVTICNENLVVRSYAKSKRVTDMISAMYPVLPSAAFMPDYTLIDNARIKDWREFWLDISASRQDLVTNCRWKYRPCNDSLWRGRWTDMGYCYSFDAGEDRFLGESGENSGLTLDLNTNQDEYLAATSLSAGFKVLLHDDDEYPNVKSRGFKIAAGSHTLASISLQNIMSMGPPHGACASKKLTNFNESEYSKSRCQTECLNAFVYEKCNCTDNFDSNFVPACDPRQSLCAQAAVSEYNKNHLEDSRCGLCPTPCTQLIYTPNLSSGVLSRHTIEAYRTQIKNNPLTAEHYKENLLRLDIFFSQLKYTEMKTREGLTLMALLCDIGGALGLVLGSTVLTLMEFLDFFLRIPFRKT